jgi:hypothetical protein
MRIADIEVDRRVVGVFRMIFPFWGMLVIVMRRRNERRSRDQWEKIGEQAAKIVTQAQDGAKTLRRLTIWLVGLTVLNLGFVAYSVLR